jgi:RNA polymerase sigma factor (TIGR02999 family)
MDSGEVAESIQKFRSGDREAEARLLEMLYPELRLIASRMMRREAPGHTLQTTALIHEAYIRMADGCELDFEDRSQLLGLAARVMRNLLIDHARSKRAQRRGGPNRHKINLEGLELGKDSRLEDVLGVHEALEALAHEDERSAKALEGHYFGGLSEKELAAWLGVSVRTIKRDLEYARAWVYDRLSTAGK